MLVVSHNDFDALPNLIRFQQEELKRGRIMVMTGNPFTQCGNGKTTAAAAVGCITDTNTKNPFNVNKHEFRLRPYLSLMRRFFNEARHSHIYYQTAVLDEGQLSIPSTEWFTVSAKSMVATSTLQRKARGLSILITPNFNFILKSVRYLVNYWAYPDTMLDESGELVGKLKVFSVSKDLWTERVTTHRLSVFSMPEKRPVWIEDFYVGLPPVDVMDAIEEKDDVQKTAFLDEADEAADAYDKHVEKQKVKTPGMLAAEMIKLPEVDLAFKKEGKVTGATISYIDKTLNTNKAQSIASIINTQKKLEAEEHAG